MNQQTTTTTTTTPKLYHCCLCNQNKPVTAYKQPYINMTDPRKLICIHCRETKLKGKPTTMRHRKAIYTDSKITAIIRGID